MTSPRQAEPIVLFVADLPDNSAKESDCFSGEQGEILKKAVTQGLRWNLERAHLVFARRAPKKGAELSETLALAREDLKREIENRRPAVIVALGAYVQQLFGLSNKSGWIESGGHLFFPTLDLRDVLADPAKKRIFWGDLKEIAGVFDRAIAGGSH